MGDDRALSEHNVQEWNNRVLSSIVTDCGYIDISKSEDLSKEFRQAFSEALTTIDEIEKERTYERR